MLDIKKFIKGLRILNAVDQTKALDLTVSDAATANTKTTVVASQTSNVTVTLPNITDTLVGKATTDVLTNKSIDADTNIITNIENADIKIGAAISRNKLAAGAIDRVLINDGLGVLTDSAVTTTELNKLSGISGNVTTNTNIQIFTNKTIDADLNVITNIENADIKALAAIDASKLADGSVSNAEFQFINSVTSNVQTQIDSKVSKAGDTMTGALVLSADPLSALQAATKQYVDGLSAGLNPKASVRVATTANLAFTYNITPSNGQFTAIGATLIIDGVTLATGNRVLIKDQTDLKQNGIYVYDSVAQTLTRSSDMDGSPTTEVSSGNYTFATQGTINEAKGFVIIGNGVLTLNTNNITFSQFSGGANSALRDLSNLTAPTAINQDLLPNTDITKSIGSSLLRYQNVFATGVNSGAGALTVTAGTDITLDPGATNKSFIGGRSVMLSDGAAVDPVGTTKDIYYNTASNRYRYNVAGAWRNLGEDSTSQTINYIKNPDAEISTAGWLGYTDINQPTPVDGTGGVDPGLLTVSSVGPLRGSKSFAIFKVSGNSFRGSGVSYDFTIDPADKAKVLQISFDYIVNAGTFAAGTSTTDSDITVYIYDVTNGVLIQPSTYKLFSNSSTVPERFIANFQTSSNSVNYRLILHVATSSLLTYTLGFDNVVIAPTQLAFGTSITDWKDYTPAITQGLGTIVPSKIRSRRVGSNQEISATFQTGAVSAVEARFSLNGVISGDTTLIPSLPAGANTAMACGRVIRQNITGAFDSVVLIEPSTGYLTFAVSNNTSNGLTKVVSTALFVSNEVVTLEASVPIQGWSSTTQMSDISDQRTVAFSATSATLTLTAADQTVNFTSIVKDTHASYSAGTYTIPISGTYNVASGLALGASLSANDVVTLKIRRNGIALFQHTVQAYTSNARANPVASGVFDANAGDLITIAVIRDAGTTGTLDGSIGNYFTLNKIANPSVISATESVAFRAPINTTTSLVPGSATLTLDTPITDTHGARSGSTYIVPTGGYYSLGFFCRAAVGTYGGGQFFAAYSINGGTAQIIGTGLVAAATYEPAVGGHASGIRLNAGDIVRWVFVNGSNGTSVTGLGTEYRHVWLNKDSI